MPCTTKVGGSKKIFDPPPPPPPAEGGDDDDGGGKKGKKGKKGKGSGKKGKGKKGKKGKGDDDEEGPAAFPPSVFDGLAQEGSKEFNRVWKKNKADKVSKRVELHSTRTLLFSVKDPSM